MEEVTIRKKLQRVDGDKKKKHRPGRKELTTGGEGMQPPKGEGLKRFKKQKRP